jgi:threonine aldolase
MTTSTLRELFAQFRNGDRMADLLDQLANEMRYSIPEKPKTNFIFVITNSRGISFSVVLKDGIFITESIQRAEVAAEALNAVRMTTCFSLRATDMAFERGRQDCLRGYSPQEGVYSYLSGYIQEYQKGNFGKQEIT